MESQLYLFFKFWAGSIQCQEKWRNILLLSPFHSCHPHSQCSKYCGSVDTVAFHGFVCAMTLSKYLSHEIGRKHNFHRWGTACFFSISLAVSITNLALPFVNCTDHCSYLIITGNNGHINNYTIMQTHLFLELC